MGNSSSKSVCPTVSESGPAIQPIVGNLTFHHLAVIVSAATAIWSGLIAVFLMIRHATHFSNPAEQKQIIRIVHIVPVFAIVSLLCVIFDGSAAAYLIPALDVGEAFPMAAFFLLMSTYLVPDEGNRDAFFDQLELIDKKGNPQGQGSLKWYRKLSIGVLQWIPVSIILWIATAIALASGTYCATSNKPHFAHIWITLIRIFSTIMAISSILRFYKRSKSVLKPRGSFKQLLCFKILVFLNFIQMFVFNFLSSGGTLHANKYLTFHDFANGLPSLILSCEIALVAPFFLVAFSPSRYLVGRVPSEEGRSPQGYHGGPFGIYAYLAAINIFDIVAVMLQAVKSHGGGSGAGLGMQNQGAKYAGGYAGGSEQYESVQGGRQYRNSRRSRRY